jgi:hypothetical protein
VPNLIADRPQWLAHQLPRLNMRRLMYQPLIFPSVVRYEAGGLGPALYAKDLQGLAHALVDGVRRDLELSGDFLGRQMLIDQAQAIELARAKARHSLRHFIVNLRGIFRSPCAAGHPSCLQTH